MISSSGLKVYARLIKSVKPYILYFVLGVLGTILLSGIDSAFMAFIKPVIDLGFVKHDQSFVRLLPLAVILIFLGRGGANFLSNYFITRVSRSVVRDFRCEIFAKLQKLPASFYDRNSSGHIVSAILYNVEQVAQASSSVLITLLRETTLFCGLVVVLFVVNWRLSLLFIIVIPPIIWVVKWSSVRMRRLSVSVQETVAEVTHLTGQTVDGYRVVRLHGGEEYENRKFVQVAKNNFHRELKIAVTSSLSGSITQALFAVPLAIALMIATEPFFHTTAGTFASIIATMVSLLQPIRRLTAVNNQIQKGIAGAQSVFNLLDEPPEVDSGQKCLTRASGDIVFDRVCFKYNNSDRMILNEVSFTVPSGKMIAIVGRSGGGKSTIVNLLPRFYELFSGSITIDGVDIREYQLNDLRKQFAYVSQNIMLFDDTILNNIAYGIGNVDRDAVTRAAEAAFAMEFISQQPEGLDALIGENGVLLSGGQRQRVAIARAILKDAPILILDEATAALDVHAEREIQKALDELMKHRTSIVIAHRLSTVENADAIVVIHEGDVVEIGSHTELLAKDGAYAALYRKQFKE